MPPRPLIRASRVRSSSGWVPESIREAMQRFFVKLYGGVFIIVALALAALLFSYDPRDPSWNTVTNATDLHNWLGAVGSYTADILRQFFGAAAYLFAIVFAAWGWGIAAGNKLDMILGRSVAALLSVLAFAMGLGAAFPQKALTGTGGAFGKLLGGGLLHLMPWAGYFIGIVMLVVTLGAIYMACALTLHEWRLFFTDVRQFLENIASFILSSVRSLLNFLRNDTSRLDDEDEDEEEDKEDNEESEERQEIEEEGNEEEDIEEKPVEKPKAKKRTAKRAKAPVITTRSAKPRQTNLPLSPDSNYKLPPLDFLQWPESARAPRTEVSKDALEKNAKLLESVLSDFGVFGQITKVSPGPVVTLYELEPSPGTRASRVISLADDIARNMSAASVRVATVPGRNVIGIELPNRRRETVYLRELLTTEAYTENKGALPIILGKDIAGTPVIADLVRMPHLLIAGTTGSGKSVAINTMILSLLYRLPPQKCRLIMIDPKMLELSVYEGIPHLLAPVVTEPKKAIVALKWVVRQMEDRYRDMSKLGVRNIEGYNARLNEAAKNSENLTRKVQTGFDRETGKPIYEEQALDLTPLPYIVVIVDEMADLMVVAGRDIESAIQRLAQMARAAGIHILMATQRPSVDVITGTIKANFPTRISFHVTSKIDSRTILGEQGAEQLLGLGDMLYMGGANRVMRVHGPFVRDDEVEAVVKFLKSQGEPEYLEEVTADEDEEGIFDETNGNGGGESNDLYDKAVDIVLRERKASISYIQRRLQVGYNRAATLIERMEREGIIGPANHVGKREILGRRPDED